MRRDALGIRYSLFPWLVTILLLTITLAGCGGTRVIVAQKTIVHQDVIYNVSNVDQLRPARMLILPDGSSRDLQKLDDRARKNLFEQYETLQIRLHFLLDDTTLPYLEGRVTSTNELRQAERQFDRALERIQKFLADRKQTQLQLK